MKRFTSELERLEKYWTVSKSNDPAKVNGQKMIIIPISVTVWDNHELNK